MAKSSLSTGNDKFLLTVIIGFAAVIVALVVGLVIYNNSHVELTYDNFDHITNMYNIENQSEGTYLVYYYSESCSHCNDIKSQVLDFASDNNANIHMYFLDAYAISGNDRVVTDPNTSAQMTGTPTLITVVNGQITHLAIGTDEVIATFNQINSGTYNYN